MQPLETMLAPKAKTSGQLGLWAHNRSFVCVLPLAYLFVVISYVVLTEYQLIDEPGSDIKIKRGLFQIQLLQAKIAV